MGPSKYLSKHSHINYDILLRYFYDWRVSQPEEGYKDCMSSETGKTLSFGRIIELSLN